MAKPKLKTYPDDTFERIARERGVNVNLLWEIKGPARSRVAWIACYAVDHSIALVQTYIDGDGWEVFTPCSAREIELTVDDALERCK